VTIVQYRKDHFEVWSSTEVPIFGLARCVIERVRETRTTPAVPGIPQAGPKESRVVTTVLDYGDGAEPLITIE
jgi:hypothetical protein